MKTKFVILSFLILSMVVTNCKKNEPSDLWGIVTDSETGEPILGATAIIFIETELITSKTTGQDGRYEFSNIASNYFYSLRVIKDGYLTVDTDEFYLPTDYSKKLDIAMHSLK